MTPINVFIVDSDARTLDALAFFLDITEDLRLIGRATTGAEALQLLAAHKPNVVLMEIKLPDTDGKALMGKIHAQYPDIGIVVLTRSMSAQMEPMLKAGASEFLQKSATIDDIANAIRSAAKAHRPDKSG